MHFLFRLNFLDNMISNNRVNDVYDDDDDDVYDLRNKDNLDK